MNKTEILQLLDEQPEDLDADQFIYTLYVRRAIEQGLADVDAGLEVSLDELDRMIDEWPE